MSQKYGGIFSFAQLSTLVSVYLFIIRAHSFMTTLSFLIISSFGHIFAIFFTKKSPCAHTFTKSATSTKGDPFYTIYTNGSSQLANKQNAFLLPCFFFIFILFYSMSASAFLLHFHLVFRYPCIYCHLSNHKS